MGVCHPERVKRVEGSPQGCSSRSRRASPIPPFSLSPFLFLLLLTPLPAFAQVRYEETRGLMGTAFRIVLYAPDSLQARRAAGVAFARIDTLDAHLSDYRSSSELSRLSATAGSGRDVPVGDDLWTVLEAGQAMARRTDGAFDVTVGPLTRLWRWAMRRAQRPPPDRLSEARRAVGYAYLYLDEQARTARPAPPGMRLDLGGIAKGYAADAAMAVLRAAGIPQALVDAGGDVVLGDPPPGAEGWRVSVFVVDTAGQVVQEEVLLARTAVATSGDTYRSVEVDGVRYSHIVDPRTGLGLTDRTLVTVRAPTGMLADALASAVSVLGPEEGVALAKRTPGVGVRIIGPEGAWSMAVGF